MHVKMRNSQRSNVWAQHLQSSACSWLLNMHLNLKAARLIVVCKRTLKDTHTHRWRQIHVRSRQQTFFMSPKMLLWTDKISNIFNRVKCSWRFLFLHRRRRQLSTFVWCRNCGQLRGDTSTDESASAARRPNGDRGEYGWPGHESR